MLLAATTAAVVIAARAPLTLATPVIASSLLSRAGLAAEPAGASTGVVHLEQTLRRAPGQPPFAADIWYRPQQAALPTKPKFAPALLLYTPGSGHVRTDNARTAATLAANGFVVVAIDDVERAPELAQAGIVPLHLDFSSAEAYAASLAGGDEKIVRQGRRLVQLLDTIEALARAPEAPPWLAGLPLEKVGAFGWSLGGASAAEASVLDPRIAAVANLDGWLFGRAARGAVSAPYLLMLSDFRIPSDADLSAADPAVRYEARLTRRDLEEERRLIARPGSVGLRFLGAVHENLSDLALGWRFWRTWFRVDPVRTKAAVDACLAAFFDHSLRGAPARGCLLPGYDQSGVQRLTTIVWPDSGSATAPM